MEIILDMKLEAWLSLGSTNLEDGPQSQLGSPHGPEPIMEVEREKKVLNENLVYQFGSK